MAKGDYLFFLDDDNLLVSGAMTELLACFARHPNAGLVAPLSIQKRSGRDNLIWTLGSDFNRWTSQPKDVMPNLPMESLPSFPIDWPTTYSPNAFMVPHKVFESIGGFDERWVQIFEESDLGWRLIESGHTAWITSRAVTEHLGFLEPDCVPTLRLLGIEKTYRTFCFARNRLWFARRHFSFLQWLSVLLIFAPLSVIWYGVVAFRNHRLDIAWAYLKGTFVGVFGEIFIRH